MGEHCKGCNKLKNEQCTRVGNRTGEIGVCWMAHGEHEYDYWCE